MFGAVHLNATSRDEVPFGKAQPGGTTTEMFASASISNMHRIGS